MEASCSCVCKFLSLVSSYLPLESQRNTGWKGPPEPSPSWKQGCLHRGTWLLSDTSWRGKKPLRMEIHKLSASWGSRALSFSLQAFSPYSLPEFPLIQFLFLLYISYYNLPYWQNRECVCFYELVHLAVFLSAKRWLLELSPISAAIRDSPVPGMCIPGISLTALCSPGCKRSMSVQCKSNAEHSYSWFYVYYTDISLSLIFHPTLATGFCLFVLNKMSFPNWKRFHPLFELTAILWKWQ